MDRRAFLKRGLVGLAGTEPPRALRLGRGRAAAAAEAKGPVITRKLGRTGIVLPVVSMGVMNADNDDLVRAALDAGMVHLDTAHGYQRGRNEEMIGRVLKGRPRDSFVIATKVWEDEKFAGLLDLSLKRLGLDYVDILYVHGLGSRKEVLSDLNLRNVESRQEERQGPVRRRFHATKTSPRSSGRSSKAKVYDVVLTAYNFRQKNIADLDKAIREAVQAGVGIVAMKTQAGAFWDKGRKDPINMTAALKWALNNPDITTAIPGFTTFDQLETDAAVLTRHHAHGKRKEGPAARGSDRRALLPAMRDLPRPVPQGPSHPRLMRGLYVRLRLQEPRGRHGTRRLAGARPRIRAGIAGPAGSDAPPRSTSGTGSPTSPGSRTFRRIFWPKAEVRP